LTALAKQRKVRVVRGEGVLTGPHSLAVADTSISFDHAVLATGSRAIRLPGVPEGDSRVMDSTAALELADIPERLLVIGGGVIGLELATVYDALGSRITVVELSGELIPGCDRDLVKPLHSRLRQRYEAIHLNTRVESVVAGEKGLLAGFEAADPAGREASPPPDPALYDRILVAVGRTPNSDLLGLEHAGVAVDGRGFVTVDSQLRTTAGHIHAIGDLVGPPLLAHKATHEARVAAEVIAGRDVEFDVRGIPSIAYTDPEVAWVGLTETAAKLAETPYRTASFPWAASGRALASDAAAGLTKLILDPDTNRILGAGIVGTNAGELIAETGLAIELETDTEDVALTIHGHPTLSETIAMASEVAEGTITDLLPAR